MEVKGLNTPAIGCKRVKYGKSDLWLWECICISADYMQMKASVQQDYYKLLDVLALPTKLAVKLINSGV